MTAEHPERQTIRQELDEKIAEWRSDPSKTVDECADEIEDLL